jgi:hypothetical protein
MCSGCGHDDHPPTPSSATLSQCVLHLTGTVLKKHSLIESHNPPSWFHIRRIPGSDLGKGTADILHVSHGISMQILVQQLQQEASYSSFTSSFKTIESKHFSENQFLLANIIFLQKLPIMSQNFTKVNELCAVTDRAFA